MNVYKMVADLRSEDEDSTPQTSFSVELELADFLFAFCQRSTTSLSNQQDLDRDRVILLSNKEK
jgi:hypothetical protein